MPVLIVDAGAMSDVVALECSRRSGRPVPVKDVETIDGHLGTK